MFNHKFSRNKVLKIYQFTRNRSKSFEKNISRIFSNLRYNQNRHKMSMEAHRQSVVMESNRRNALRKELAASHGVSWKRIVLMNTLRDYRIALNPRKIKEVMYVVKNRNRKNDVFVLS